MRARKLPAHQRRRDILHHAERLFATRPYAHVTTAELARAAGVAEATLYRYFEGKKGLFIAVLRQAGQGLLALWQRLSEELHDPLRTLWAIGVGYYDHVNSRSAAVAAQFQALSEAADPEIQAALRENYAALTAFLRDLLEEAKARGEVDPHVPTEAAAWQLLGNGLALDVASVLGLRERMQRRHVELLWEIALEGLQRRGSAWRRPSLVTTIDTTLWEPARGAP